jgi:hypothetical protein
MKESWKWVAGVMLGAVILFGMVAPGLRAGRAAGGKFTLPFDARWETSDLSTGDYSFSVDHLALNGIIRVYRGRDSVGILRAVEFDGSRGGSETAELVCVRHDGIVSVRALRLPQAGTFYFPLPADMTQVSGKQPLLLETVSVRVSGD